jgi:hypothetical protein
MVATTVAAAVAIVAAAVYAAANAIASVGIVVVGTPALLIVAGIEALRH